MTENRVTPADDAPPPIVPALWPTEWRGAKRQRQLSDGYVFLRGRDVAVAVGDKYVQILRPHAAAALCLYGQEYGFTHDDVQICTQAAAFFAAKHDGDCVDAEWFMGLAARIAALLPPEDQTP